MADKITNALTKTANVMVMYDKTTLNKIEFILPNDKMASMGLVTTQQQIEINNSINCYTSGKNYITWSMVGVVNILDLIRAIRRQKKKLKDSYFNKMKSNMHFTHIEFLENRIIYELDGTQMCKLNSEWENEIADELRKHNIFHHFESVIINRNNKNKTEKKNQNKDITDMNKNDKNLVTFDSLLDVWDMDINNVQNESKCREKEICRIMIESFGCLEAMHTLEKQLDSSYKEYNRFDIELYLKQREKNNQKENTFNEDVLTVKNKLELEKENIFSQKMKMKERERINVNEIKVSNTHIEEGKNFLVEQKEQEKHEMKIMEICKEIVGECEKLMKVYDNSSFKIGKEICQLNYMVNDIEWTIFKRTVGNQIKIIQRKSMLEEENVYENVFDQKKTKQFDITNHSLIENKTFIECADRIYVLKISGINFCNDNSICSLMKTSIEDKLRVVLNYLVCIFDSKLSRNIKIYVQGWYGRSVVFDSG